MVTEKELRLPDVLDTTVDVLRLLTPDDPGELETVKFGEFELVAVPDEIEDESDVLISLLLDDEVMFVGGTRVLKMMEGADVGVPPAGPLVGLEEDVVDDTSVLLDVRLRAGELEGNEGTLGVDVEELVDDTAGGWAEELGMTTLEVLEDVERLELGAVEDDMMDEPEGVVTDAVGTSVVIVVRPEAVRVVVAIVTDGLLGPKETLDVAVVDPILAVGTDKLVEGTEEDPERVGDDDELIDNDEVPGTDVEGAVGAVIEPPDTVVGDPLGAALIGVVSELDVVDNAGVDVPNRVDPLMTVVTRLVIVEVGPLGM